ncbi:MAG: FTR1 family protein [Dehalococcoidia bacterium]|nr:FTR1 family protein [Dehalococcoidia bacterium]
MIGPYLLTFREGLEAAMIIAIILAYLSKTQRGFLSRYIWYGVTFSIILALILGVSSWLLYGAIPKSAQVLFEGGAALLAVVVLTTMIFWMATKGREIRTEIEQRVKEIATRGAVLGLVSFAFIVVFREGLETVVFLMPFLVDNAGSTLIGAVLGMGSALILSSAIYVFGMRINLGKFFYYSSLLLILLAGGLFGYGVHELVEYGQLSGVQLGWLSDYAYVLNIPADSIFHHKGAVGSIFAVMLGYTVKAEWARVIVHIAYLAVALPLVIRVYRKGGSSSVNK